MSASDRQSGFVLLQAQFLSVLQHRRVFSVALAASLAAALYWSAIASDRYVAEARIVVQHTDLVSAPSMDFGSLVGSLGSTSRSEQLLLREFLQSVDMLRKLDESLSLRAHYSDWHRDPFSRMWSATAPIEWFHGHYRSRVSVELDEYAGVLVIRAQAYAADTANAIVTLLIEEGESFMNRQAHALAQEQVSFLEGEVARVKSRAMAARQSVLAYQDEKGLVSPLGSAENAVGIIGRLEARRTELLTRRNALLAYLMPSSPNVEEVDAEVNAVEKQIADERAHLAAPTGETLNRTVEAFRRLQMEAEFTEEIYRSALTALERGRVEATRLLKKVSVVQSPTVPQYPLEPRRLYNTVVFVLAVTMLAGIVHLIAAIIRDHKD